MTKNKKFPGKVLLLVYSWARDHMARALEQHVAII